MDIHGFFTDGKVDLQGLSGWLDGLETEARIAAVRALSAKEQAALFDAAEGFKAVDLDFLVPPDRGAMKPVRHYGRNSLPLFRIFEKRFVRPAEGGARLWGYNEQPTRWATGPGYFVVHPHGEGEVLVDYTELPDGAPPEGWPEVKPNAAGLSRFVYNGMQDVVRGVSRHVSIGRATRGGKPENNWFVLCREA